MNNRPIPSNTSLPELQRVINKLCDIISNQNQVAQPQTASAAKIVGTGTATAQNIGTSFTTIHMELTVDAGGVVHDSDGNAILRAVEIREIAR